MNNVRVFIIIPANGKIPKYYETEYNILGVSHLDSVGLIPSFLHYNGICFVK